MDKNVSFGALVYTKNMIYVDYKYKPIVLLDFLKKKLAVLRISIFVLLFMLLHMPC